MESTIVNSLRKIAIKAMEEVIENEVRLTAANEKELNNYKKKNTPLGIYISLDIGWNKRCSRNQYESLSDHALMIGCA